MFFYSQTWHLLRSDCLCEWCIQYCFTNGHSSDTDRCKYCVAICYKENLECPCFWWKYLLGVCGSVLKQRVCYFSPQRVTELKPNLSWYSSDLAQSKRCDKPLREAVRGNESCQPRTRWQQLHVLFLPVLQNHLYDCFLLIFRMALFQNRTTEWFEMH